LSDKQEDWTPSAVYLPKLLEIALASHPEFAFGRGSIFVIGLRQLAAQMYLIGSLVKRGNASEDHRGD
jgi:hypothetical protein